MPNYTIIEYKYKVGLFHKVYFYARTQEKANEMKELYEKGMGVELKLKKSKEILISKPPYEYEQEQLECLKRGNGK